MADNAGALSGRSLAVTAQQARLADAEEGLMASYYVNKIEQANGDHEVHREGCFYMPASTNRIYLGEFYSCVPAVIEARKYYMQSNGCIYCSRECHTG